VPLLQSERGGRANKCRTANVGHIRHILFGENCAASPRCAPRSAPPGAVPRSRAIEVAATSPTPVPLSIEDHAPFNRPLQVRQGSFGAVAVDIVDGGSVRPGVIDQVDCITRRLLGSVIGKPISPKVRLQSLDDRLMERLPWSRPAVRLREGVNYPAPGRTGRQCRRRWPIDAWRLALGGIGGTGRASGPPGRAAQPDVPSARRRHTAATAL